MASVDEDFPRGGISKKTPESKVKPKQHIEVDNLFQEHEPEVTPKRKGPKKDEGSVAKKQKKNENEVLKLNATPIVDILHMKDLKVGTLLLGCVKKVGDLEVTVSLPCGLIGYLAVSNISDPYKKLLSAQLSDADAEDCYSLPELLSPGTLLRCAVVSVEGRKGVSIQLSINPKVVNKGLSSGSLKAGMVLSGCVESVEDHGYLVDIGVSGTRAFLPKQAVTDKSNSPKELNVGQCLLALLEEVKDNGRMVRLSVVPSAVAQAIATTQHGWTLTNLLPGLLVKAQIKEVTTHGLVMEFLSSFSGLVDFMHVVAGATYRKGDEVKACVLYVEPSTRLVGLSLHAHLLHPGRALEPTYSEQRIGEVIDGCKMTSLHHNSGATLEFPDQSPAFAHRNHMREPQGESNLDKIMAKPEHTCRIIDYNHMEQLYSVSLRKSIIEESIFRYDEINAGQFVEGTVVSLETFGMIVKVTNHVRGVVPKLHLSDITLKNPEKKYTAGMKLKCRVLAVDAEQKKLTLTRKKALIESSLPLFLSYADARPGRISHGFIACVKEFGCIVCFYNGIAGLVPISELSAEPVLVPQTLFYVGQVVKAKVLSCDPDNEKLRLSFKAVADGETEAPNKEQFDFEIGKKVEARVLTKIASGVKVSILPEEAPALLPTSHFSDHVSNCSLLWEAVQTGDTISNLLCLSKGPREITLTKKPLLRWALETGVVVKEFSDLQKGMQLIGWIRNIMPFGVFVAFPCGLVGLAPKAHMCDKFISDTAGPFQPGQTVVAKVIDLDEAKRRFVVSLKASEVVTPGGDAQTRLAQGLQERRAVADMMASRDDSEVLQELSKMTVGQRIMLTVDEVDENQSVSLKSDELKGATITAAKKHCLGVEVTAGQKVNAVVLHVEPLNARVHVSLLPKLVAKKQSLDRGETYSATVQYTDRDFAVISLGNTAQLTIIQTTNHLNDTLRSGSEKLSPGATLKVIVIEPSCEGLEGLPQVEKTKSKNDRESISQADGKSTSKECCYGDVVKGKVKSIKPTCVMVELEGGMLGRVHVSEVVDEVGIGSFPTSSLRIGSEVTGRVIGSREDIHSHSLLPITRPQVTCRIPELTLRPSRVEGAASLEPDKDKKKAKKSYEAGENIICFVSKYNQSTKCLEMTISPSVTGFVELQDMITDPKSAKHPEKLFKQGQAIRARVVKGNSSKDDSKRLHLTLAAVAGSSPELKAGDMVSGVVGKVQPHLGLQVKLPQGKGTVSLVDLADGYKNEPLKAYKEGQLIRCSVIGVKCAQEKGWHLSLRHSRLNPGQVQGVKDPEVLSIEELKTGQTIRGFVTCVKKEGVFMRLSRTVTGRAEFQQVTRYYVGDINVYKGNIAIGNVFTTKILSVDKEEGQVSLSLLSEDTGKPDVLPESLGLPLRLKGEEKEKHDTKKRKRKSSETQQESPQKQTEKATKKKKTKKAENGSNGTEVYIREEEEEEIKTMAVKVEQRAPARLQISGGFSWDTALSTLKPASSAAGGGDSSEGEDEEEEQSRPQKKSRQERETEQQQAEKALTRRETELMDPDLRPQDADGFERLLLASPDSSLLWLQYMTFHLQATQIEQARAVAERALKTISFREEQEKLNVWVALLNLENLYGTEDGLKAVFQRALQFCEPMPVYQQLADIYAKSGKTKEAENLYKSMVTRFKKEKAVWVSYGSFLLQQGQGEAASGLLQRALRCLTSKENVDVIVKFAQLEFRFGDVEKAKSMLDKVLTSYPKRTDLWSVFIDLMIKHGSQKEVRALFDRVIHLSVKVTKIKFFFKRYLEYEKKNGTLESVQAVKEKALEYVESKTVAS